MQLASSRSSQVLGFLLTMTKLHFPLWAAPTQQGTVQIQAALVTVGTFPLEFTYLELPILSCLEAPTCIAESTPWSKGSHAWKNQKFLCHFVSEREWVLNNGAWESLSGSIHLGTAEPFAQCGYWGTTQAQPVSLLHCFPGLNLLSLPHVPTCFIAEATIVILNFI